MRNAEAGPALGIQSSSRVRKSATSDRQPNSHRTVRGKPETNRLLFLNAVQARLGEVNGTPLPTPYRDACRLLRTGLIDRTGMLDMGVPYAVLDPLPEHRPIPATFAQICDAVANDIAAEALDTGRRLQVLWSGGIDSTTALVALTRALRQRDATDIIDVLLSAHSVTEYPRFYADHIKNALTVIPVSQPLGMFVRERDFTVTGEHGDQIFGSFLVRELVDAGTANAEYESVIPGFFARRIGNSAAAERVFSFLLPQVQSAPVPVRTAFDFLWWLNFSLKWQAVSLRVSVARQGNVSNHFKNTRHFFRDPRFQLWAMTHPELRITSSWRRYKLSAKEYLRDYTGDEEYYWSKTKESSLKNVLGIKSDAYGRRICVYMAEDFVPQFRSVGRGALLREMHAARDMFIGASR